MAIMPGAKYRPIPIASTRAMRRKGRGIVLHVAVSEAPSLFGFFSTASVDSHFYVAKDGTIEQYVDTDRVAYANAAGNSTLISVETQGGMTNADGEPWTPQQVASLVRLVRWASETDGFPLQTMPDSRATSKGVGWHKLGVAPWIVSGGEKWSSSYGKICPGAAKIAQVPGIVAAARADSAPAPAGPPPARTASLLPAGATLNPGESLTAAAWRAVMQGDGNFVVYEGGTARWSSQTDGNPGARLVMQADGNAVVYSAANRPLWDSGTDGDHGDRLVIQTDGNLVIYRPDGRAVWSRR